MDALAKRGRRCQGQSGTNGSEKPKLPALLLLLPPPPLLLLLPPPLLLLPPPPLLLPPTRSKLPRKRARLAPASVRTLHLPSLESKRTTVASRLPPPDADAW